MIASLVAVANFRRPAAKDHHVRAPNEISRSPIRMPTVRAEKGNEVSTRTLIPSRSRGECFVYEPAARFFPAVLQSTYPVAKETFARHHKMMGLRAIFA